MNRDLYTVLVTSTNGITPRVSRNDTHELISKLVSGLIIVNNNPATPEDMHLKAIGKDLARYEVVSWDLRRMPPTARVGQIPKPGVIFVIESEMVDAQDGEIMGLMLQVKQELSRDGGPPKFQRHLAGPWAHWSPQPLSTFDVLVSASDVDDAVAIEIERRLAESGLSTERSVRPSTAELDDESRRQLLECQVLISLLTPASAHDPRVAIEAGACWVLTKPFVPVLSGLAKTELPPSMAARQFVEFDDQTAVNRLPGQITALVLGR